jgi:hypothetical protein
MIYFSKENEIIQVGKHITIHMGEDDHESNILFMEEVEKTPGFMYWLNTPEGVKMANEVSQAIAKSISDYYEDHPE